MNIIIVEDELRTARSLVAILKEIQPEIQIMGILPSVHAAVTYFSSGPEVDLIFMDILLSDGHCFDIFEEIDIAHPIIFCTAYNDYMTAAFKVNSIDYILKPFNKETITHALDKFQKLKTHFSSADPGVNPASTAANSRLIVEHKQSILVLDNNSYRMLAFDQIAYFYLVGGLPAIKTFNGKTIFTDQSLSAVMELLPRTLFYKINRQYIIQKGAISEVIPSYLRNLEIKLKVPVNEKLMVNKNKRTEFLHWLKN